MAIATLPIAEPGMRIGLFGGSFNPAHEGHRLVALECLKRLALDKVWLLVSPGNPLKSRSELSPLDERFAGTVKVMDDPRLEVTGFEQGHHFTYTWETLRFLTTSHPEVKFVWIMGADSLQNFEHWERWRDIAGMMPIAVYARPGSTYRAATSAAAIALASARLPEDQATILADAAPPAWVYLRGVMSTASSTAIREARAKATTLSDEASAHPRLVANSLDLGFFMPNRVALLVFAACLASPPAFAQMTFSMGVGAESGGSTATVTTTQAPPVFTGDFAGANVLSGVNIRNAPSSQTGQITGTLHPGGTVMARCQRGWCELQDGGYVGQKFLSFDATGSFDVVPPPPTDTATTDATATVGTDSTTSLAPPTSAGSVSANFDGAWQVTNDPSGQAVPLTLAQTGESVSGTLEGKTRVTKITGDVEGTKLSFTYQMVNAKGAQVATGNGFLTLTTGGQALTGALMLNGLVIANINAVR